MGGSTRVVGVVIEHHKNERAVVATDIALVVENQQLVLHNKVANSARGLAQVCEVCARIPN